MSAHDSHNPDIENSGELKSKTSFRSSFWFVIILVGLFIAALNFVHSASQEHEGGQEAKTSEHAPGAQEAYPHEAGGHDASQVTDHNVSGHEVEEARPNGADSTGTVDSAGTAIHR